MILCRTGTNLADGLPTRFTELSGGGAAFSPQLILALIDLCAKTCYRQSWYSILLEWISVLNKGTLLRCCLCALPFCVLFLSRFAGETSFANYVEW